MIDERWELNQQNRILFVLVDAAYTEVPGLGNTFVLNISKDGGAFAPSAGVKAEISNGGYAYLATAAEADTIGPVLIYITGVGIIQQNLEYVVMTRVAGAVPYTYTVTDSGTGLPIAGVDVWCTTDAGGANVVWNGVSDAFGIARDAWGRLPYLDPGTYYFWKQRAGFIDDQNPDIEVVP